MFEGAPTEIIPEDPNERDRREQEEGMARYLAENPDRAEQASERLAEVATAEALLRSTKESGPAIAFLEGMMRSFEATYPLGELHAIVDLKPEDAPRHPIREPAKLALIPIVAALNALKTETNITGEEYQRVKAEYRRLSQAVGMISGGKVDHTR